MAITYEKALDQVLGTSTRTPKILRGCVGGAANTRTDIPHGCNYTPQFAIPVLEGTDNDSAESPVGAVIEVVEIDATNVVVKCATGSMPFSMLVI